MGTITGFTAENGYYLVSPEGRKVPIDRKVFFAVEEMIRQQKQGSVTIAFISGGVRSVVMECMLK